MKYIIKKNYIELDKYYSIRKKYIESIDPKTKIITGAADSSRPEGAAIGY